MRLSALHADIDVVQLHLSPDGKVLYQLSADLWTARALPGGEALWREKFPGASVHRCFFNSDATLLAAAMNDGTIDLLSCRDGKTTGHLTGHTAAVESCAFTPDGTRLVSTAGLSDVKIWDVHGCSEAASLRAMFGLVHTVAITGDGRHLLRSNTAGWTLASP